MFFKKYSRFHLQKTVTALRFNVTEDVSAFFFYYWPLVVRQASLTDAFYFQSLCLNTIFTHELCSRVMA